MLKERLRRIELTSEQKKEFSKYSNWMMLSKYLTARHFTQEELLCLLKYELDTNKRDDIAVRIVTRMGKLIVAKMKAEVIELCK
jgi:hypothetical protein